MIKGFPVNQENFYKHIKINQFKSGIPIHKISYKSPTFYLNSDEAIADGLVSYYKFDEESGNTCYSEINGFSATATNATIDENGFFSRCRKLSSSSYITLANDMSSSDTAFTRMILIYMPLSFKNAAVYKTIFQIDTNQFAGNLTIQTNNKIRYVVLANPEGWMGGVIDVELSTFSDDSFDKFWQIVCVTTGWGGGKNKIYINGQFISENTISGLKYSSRPGTNLIGASSNSFNEKVDEFCFWRRELILSEITELYNDGKGKLLL